MAVFGFMGKKALLSHKGDFKLFGAGEIPFYDIAIALMVASGLFLVFLVLVLLKGEAVEK
jgi:hypothetical protein